jgi:hypothetical protein
MVTLLRTVCARAYGQCLKRFQIDMNLISFVFLVLRHGLAREICNFVFVTLSSKLPLKNG